MPPPAPVSPPPNSSLPRPRRGIFGGTFNPPHSGHLQIALIAQQQAELTEVLWVPTYHPPHRAPETLISFEHRLEMVQRAIAPYPSFQVSAIEQQIGQSRGQSFAIHTLTQLQQQYPQSHWCWILGLDAFCTLPRWYHNHQLVPQCTWLVAPRQNAPVPNQGASNGKLQAAAIAHQFQQQGIALRWHWLDMPPVAVSSSQIRRYCGDRQPITGLVPEAVEAYIHNHNLYTPKS